MKSFKNINKICTYLVILLVSLVSVSCKKLIEIPKDPSDKIPEANIFADSVNTMSAVAGIYTNFKIVNNFSFAFHNGGIGLNTGLAGDELKNTNTYDLDEPPFYNNAILPNNGRISNFWKDAYSSLYQINACLIGVSQSTGISATLKKQLTGEIKVIRALYYFNLVNVFGKVPLVLTTDYKVNAKLPRATEEEVYAQIIADLNEAKSLLKPAYPSVGPARPNVYAATSLLAKVYLYKKQYALAASMASEVINSGVYSLTADIGDVFLNGSREAIWQIPAIGTSGQTAEAAILVPSFGSPNYTIAAPLLAAIEAGDLRKTKWMGISTIGTTTVYYPAKYKSKSNLSTRLEGYMVLRLSDVYLIRAEANAQQNLISDALDDLRKIRNMARVGLAEYAGSTAQTAVLAAIMHERQIELFCEWGNRWFDLKRSGNINTVLGAIKPGWQATDALFPVPITELQTNPFLDQNPGYN